LASYWSKWHARLELWIVFKAIAVVSFCP